MGEWMLEGLTCAPPVPELHFQIAILGLHFTFDLFVHLLVKSYQRQVSFFVKEADLPGVMHELLIYDLLMFCFTNFVLKFDNLKFFITLMLIVS